MAAAAQFATRYAQALAEVVDAAKIPAADVQSQLAGFGETLAESAPLREVLANPSIPVDQKIKVIDAICAKTKYIKPVRNFIAVLVAHDRISAFAEIAGTYATLADEEQGIHHAEITTARDLTEASRNALESKVRSIAGGKLTATYKQDATLLGGAIIRIGSTVYDGSIRGQLQRLKETLQGA
ncbi:MAG TPA: ATP synthase F1 subunit delta [Acidobacteriaceae bacterium]|jgi:F-type H+-transporting ATPase subunit delta|nr:ATP synthase F1 subunit delta [Acidobacteriaceae bacterium]